MAIDANLGAGLIGEDEASAAAQLDRRRPSSTAPWTAPQIRPGDAVAGIVVTVINVVGGLIIGVARHDGVALAAQELHPAHHRRRPDLAQIPSLIISILRVWW